MARLPQPGGDNGDWGDILNDYLSQALKSNGLLKDNAVTSNTIAPNSVTNAAIASNAVNAASIADGSITNALIADGTIQEVKLSNSVQTKLNAGSSTPDWSAITNKPAVIAAGADQAAARAVIGAGTASTKSDVGLDSVDNTSDAAKPISTATQTGLNGKVDTSSVDAAATASKIAQRDANANLLADAFIPSLTSTVTAAGTTTLTVDDTELQQFTGSTTQNVLLPTTSVVAGQRYTIINKSTGSVTIKSSGNNTILGLTAGRSATFIALVTTPTALADWHTQALPVIVDSSGPGTGTIASRDSRANLTADAFIPSLTSTATAAGTTTLTADSTELQQFTGSTTQTVVLPTTSVLAGQRYTIVNSSTGALTVNASGGTLVKTINGGHFAVVTALQATPTTNAHWVAQYLTNITPSVSAAAGNIAQRDAQANLLADAFIPGFTTTATAAGTTTLTVDSTEVQEFTGSTTQTVVLPTTGVAAGQRFSIINDATAGFLTVNASGGGNVGAVGFGISAIVTALVATPTTSANWSIYYASTSAISTSSSANSVARRDGQANLLSNAFIPNLTSTATAGATTTLTGASTEVQVFTGSTTQTVVLPTTSIVTGQHYTIINSSTGGLSVQASAGGAVVTVDSTKSATFSALQATPTLPAHWAIFYHTAAAFRIAAQASTVAVRDNQANLFADAFIPSLTSTATAAATTTLTVDSTEVQLFTGSTTQTVLLPTTSILAGQRYTIINNSTGNVTVQSSGANTILGIPASNSATFVALQATPTAASHWQLEFHPGFGSGTGGGNLTLVQRNSQGNIFTDAFVPGLTSTPTAAGTTTLTSSSTQIQAFTGSTTQTVVLPTTTIIEGFQYTIINNSSGAVTVNSSGSNLVKTLAAGASTVVTALVAAPTTAADWYATA